MGILAGRMFMQKDKLSEFQRFLVSHKFALPENAPFYAYWVRRNKYLREMANNQPFVHLSGG